MKRCPTCNRTFEDTFTFCLIDGAVLSAPFDPQDTPGITEPEQPEPPTVKAPANQAEKTEEIRPSQPTSAYKAASSPVLTAPVKKSNWLPLILGGAALVALLVIGVTALLFATRAGSTTENSSSAKTGTTNGTPNKNQSTGADDSSRPPASSSSVINLEGTTWRNKDGNIFKFMKGGKYVVPDPDIPCNWTQDEEKVFMRCHPTKTFVGAKDYGTIKGDRIEGYSVHDDGKDRENWVMFRQK